MINDVTELVSEAARVSGRSDLAAYAPMMLGFLESSLNTSLRTSGMIAEATLTTDASGLAALPTDYLEAVSVTYGTDKRKLNRITRVSLNQGVSGYVIGTGFTSSVTEADHALIYYQRLPSAWENGTNWLMAAKPEIYLRGLVFEAHKDSNDAEAAIAAKVLFDTAVRDLKRDDRTSRRIDTIALPGTQI